MSLRICVMEKFTRDSFWGPVGVTVSEEVEKEWVKGDGDGETEGVGMGLRVMCSILQCALHCAVLSSDSVITSYIPSTHSLLYVWLCVGLMVVGKGWGQGRSVCTCEIR